MTTILVIEDEAQIRENIVQLLLADGFTAVSAGDGRAGLELAVRLQPDLIVSDVVMPELDGFALLRELRKEPATSGIPFIFLTAKTERADVRMGMNLGADDYLTKPFSRRDLLDCVQSRLRRGSSPAARPPAAEPDEPIASLRAGQLFDRYLIEESVGVGGMGRVYRARDTKLDRLVALKVMKMDDAGDAAARETASARLVAEARAAARLTDPHVVAIYDVGTFLGLPFLAMEFVTGRTLRESGDATVTQKVRWLRDVAQALSVAHRARIVHRDIKPDNVMVRGNGRAVVLDFGIARASLESTLLTLSTLSPESGRIRGTIPYMSPEQLGGAHLDGRSDQFAWGVMAYELLAGRSPWGDSEQPMRIVMAILHSEPPPLASVAPMVPAEVAAIVGRALSKGTDDRFSSMDEVLDRLSATGLVDPARVSSGNLAREAAAEAALQGPASGTPVTEPLAAEGPVPLALRTTDAAVEVPTSAPAAVVPSRAPRGASVAVDTARSAVVPMARQSAGGSWSLRAVAACLLVGAGAAWYLTHR